MSTAGKRDPRTEADRSEQPGWADGRIREAVRTRLAPRLHGALFLPGDPGYDEERAGYNTILEHRPAVVVGADGPADVMAAVAFAARHGLPVGVRNTGHGASVPADDALLVSTRRLRGVRVDPMARVARVEAGVRWERVIHEAAAFGLAPLSGSAPDVGVVGYTLGGGIGVLGRRYGYAADHVRSIDIVTANGVQRQVSAQQYPDLFWALRGGKGNFGVVTSMEINLFPVTSLYGGGLYFRASAAREVFTAYRRFVRALPERMTSSIALVRFPWGAPAPEPLRGRFVVHVRIAFDGPPDEGERLVRPLRTVAPALLDTVTTIPYAASGAIHADPVAPFPLYERTAYLRELDEDAADALLHLAGPDSTCPMALVELRHLGGALGRPPEVPNAVGHRDAAFLVYLAAVHEVAGPSAVPDSAEAILAAMAPWTGGGAALNFMGPHDATPERVRAAYTDADYRRLVAVKRAYDPDNVFRVNHNIPPVS